MALLTAQGISALGVPLLRRNLVLVNTVASVAGAEFAGSNGDTVTVRVRQPRTANVQATPGASITFTPVSEVGVDVSLTHLYDAVNLTDEELSLELVDYATQVTEPQVAAVATGAEDELAGAMNDLVADETDLAASNAKAKILAAREALSQEGVPLDNRFCAVSPAAVTLLLGIEEFTRADATGDNTALREAVVGRLFSFTFVESSGLTGGDDGQAMVFYHRSGWAFANRAPVAPRGAVQSASTTDNGIGLRQIFQYAPGTLTDQSVISTFAGASLVSADRVYKVEDATI